MPHGKNAHWKHEGCLSEKKYDESRLLRHFDEPRRLCGKRMRVKRYAEAKPRGLSPHRTKECSLVASRKEDPLSIVVWLSSAFNALKFNYYTTGTSPK
ncbi:MAG: hypothetical protein BHV62_03205 [Eggerthella sp. 51_9]|nr:MAG: hypothetical protein BHV62_03205 [Eggerthella sp. 51_9]